MEQEILGKSNGKTIVIGIGLLFVLFPYFFYILTGFIDNFFGAQQLLPFPFNVPVAIIPLIAGWILFSWTLTTLYEALGARGIARFFLITNGPFFYSRNPLILAFGFWLLGFGILLNSFALLLLSASIWLGLVMLLRLEERKLALIFGKIFNHYTRNVPFLMPNFNKIRIYPAILTKQRT